MTLLGSGWVVPAPLAVPDPSETLLARVLLAVEALQATFAQMPAPIIELQPNDFTDIVTAVQDLKGPNGPSAADIAAAIKEVLAPTPAPATDAVTPALVKALEQLDFRMKGMGGSGGVGGTVATISNDVAVKPAAGTTAFPVSVQTGTINVERSLTERMLAKAPQVNYSLYLDTADTTYIYLAEGPTTDTATSPTAQGIRVVKDASGNPLGRVQIATGFVWNSRSSASWV